MLTSKSSDDNDPNKAFTNTGNLSAATLPVAEISSLYVCFSISFHNFEIKSKYIIDKHKTAALFMLFSVGER